MELLTPFDCEIDNDDDDDNDSKFRVIFVISFIAQLPDEFLFLDCSFVSIKRASARTLWRKLLPTPGGP